MLEDLLKWAGATAPLLWVPIGFNFVKRHFFAQQVIVIIDQKAIIGFSPDLGSHILIRLGMYTSSNSYSEDIVFKKISLRIRTPENGVVVFGLSKSEDTIDSKLVNEKSQESIAAVRVLPNILHLLKSGYATDKHMWFFDSNSTKGTEKEWKAFNEQENHLVSSGNPKSDLIGTKELGDLIRKINASFFWGEGEYNFEIEAEAINKK